MSPLCRSSSYLVRLVVEVSDAVPGHDKDLLRPEPLAQFRKKLGDFSGGSIEHIGRVGDPVPDVSGGPGVDVRVEGRDDRVVERKLDVEEARDLSQEREKPVFVHLVELAKLLRLAQTCGYSIEYPDRGHIASHPAVVMSFFYQTNGEGLGMAQR